MNGDLALVYLTKRRMVREFGHVYPMMLTQKQAK